MNIKQKLLQTLNGLEMPMKWKSQFADTLIEVLELEEKDDSIENNTGSAIKEGDVLYYRQVNSEDHSNLISSVNSNNTITGITQLAVYRSKNPTSLNTYGNEYWDEWNVSNNIIYKGSTTAIMAQEISGVKFTVGADNKDLIAVSNSDKDITDSEKYFTQITEEEYNNIFN